MPYHGIHKNEIESSINELTKSGEHYLTGEDFRKDIRNLAKILHIDFDKSYDIGTIRKILGKGTPISTIVSEMRNEQY